MIATKPQLETTQLETTQLEIAEWVRAASRLFWDDATVRMPRTEAARRNALEGWLAEQQAKLRANFEHAHPSAAALFDPLIWPEVEPEVRRYAIFGFAAAWVGRHLGDATTIGTPTLGSYQWRVPLGVNGYRDDLGQIVLTLDGDVIAELTTTRSELLEAIREPSFSVFTAAAR